jgi:anti-anti-sigma factor
MPGSRGRNFTVTITVSPDHARAVVLLAGELDMDAQPELADAVGRLTAVAPHDVDVDLASVRYAGSVLLNFLVQIRQTVPAVSALTVSHPSPWIHRVLGMTDAREIAGIDDALSA